MAISMFGVYILLPGIITCVYGRIVKLDSNLLSDVDFFNFDIEDESDIRLDRFHEENDEKLPNFMLKSMNLYKTDDYFQQTGKLISVRHFGRHYLCDKERSRLYRALRQSICNTNSRFIYQLIGQLCEDKGKQLDTWVSELFDVTGDGYVNHYERYIYDKSN